MSTIAELMNMTPDAYRPDLVTAEQIEQHLAELDGRWFNEDPAVFGWARELAHRHPSAERRGWWFTHIQQRAIDLRIEHQRRIDECVRREAEWDARQKAERRAQRKAERQAAKQAQPAAQPEPALVERAQHLLAQGRQPIPACGMALLTEGEDYRKPYAIEDFAHPRATDLQIVLGEQPDGSRLTLFDLDTHHAGQDADAARAALERECPELARHLHWYRSRGGKGWNALVKSYKEIPAGKLYDADGRHIGEVVTTRTPDPGDMPTGVLNQTQIEQLLAYWPIEGGAQSSESWRGLAAEGQKYARTWSRYQATKDDLSAFLRKHGGTVGAHLADLFDTRAPFNRSDAAGALMQCLMFNIHKIAPAAGYSERCARAMALWMAAKTYGKASDKDYNQELDGYALITKCLTEAPKDNGGRWRAPFWAKAHPTPPRIELPTTPQPAPRRPAHRPAGDHAKMLRKIRRYFELRAFECDDRKVYYNVADTAAAFGMKPRTFQAYLQEIIGNGSEIQRGQDPGPGGRAWLIWGADNSAKQPEPAAADTPIWGADANATQRVPAPKTADRAPLCKEDHQNPCAPPPPAAPGGSAGPHAFGDLACATAGAPAWRLTCDRRGMFYLRGPAGQALPVGFDAERAERQLAARLGAQPEAEPGGATYDPRRDCIEGSDHWTEERDKNWVSPTEPRVRPDAPPAPPPPRVRRQHRPKGQKSFLGRGGEQVGARFMRRTTVGSLPAPARYRPVAAD